MLEAKQDNGQAQQALENAYNAKVQAENAKTNAEQALKDAEQALSEAQTELTDAQRIMDAAQKQRDSAEAQKALEQAEAERDQLADAPEKLNEAEKALNDAQKAYDDAYQDYIDSNTDIIPADDGSDDVNSKLDALDKAQTELDAAKAAYENAANRNEAYEAAKQAATDAKANADAAAQTAKDALDEIGTLPTDEIGSEFAPNSEDTQRPATITAGGDVTITSGGSVSGENGESLTLDTAGKVKIDANGDVSITDTQDLTIDEIIADGDADITAVGDITSTGKDPAISADKIELDAIQIDDEPTKIGSKDDPLHVSTDEMGACGGDVNVDNDGSVILDDVVADHFHLNADGDISQKDDTRVDAKELELEAGGNIGSVDKPIEIDSDRISAKGGDIYIDNKSHDLTVDEITGKKVEIKTDGDINTAPDGKITAKDLIIDARDDIGKPDAPINIDVSGKVVLKTLRGHTYGEVSKAKREKTVLVDPESKVKVVGYFASNAYIEVINTNHLARLLHAELLESLKCECVGLKQYSADCTAWHDVLALQTLMEQADCEGCSFLWKLISEGKTLYDLALGIFGATGERYEGSLYFTFDLEALGGKPVEQLEGETLYVLCCVDGEVICIETTVQDGCVSFTLGALGKANLGYTEFVILNAETFEAMWQAGEIPAQRLLNKAGRTIESL